MNTEIIEKIKALLRLAQSSNPHEAALALQRALELASKHSVDVESLDLDARSEKILHEWFHTGQRLSFLQKRCFNIVIRFFSVEVCISGDRTVFVGKATDVAIAHYVFDFLVVSGRRWLRDYERAEKSSRRKMSASKRRNFTQGFIYGIAEQLDKSKKQILDDSRTAIVVADKAAREAYMAELVPDSEKIKLEDGRKNYSALVKGFAAGQNTRINKPLEGGGRQPALALPDRTARRAVPTRQLELI